MGKYSQYIMEDVRRNLGLEYDDESRDEDINNMEPDEVFERFLTWQGIMGYSSHIIHAVRDIYGTGYNKVIKGVRDPYKVQQMTKMLNADYFWALLTSEKDVAKNINLTEEAIEILIAFYEGKQIMIKE